MSVRTHFPSAREPESHFFFTVSRGDRQKRFALRPAVLYGLLGGLPDYSDERDELSVALYGDVQVLSIDQDGRIVLPEKLRAHAGIGAEVAFVGLGEKFQMWEPGRFEARRARARQKVDELRKLLGAKAAERTARCSSTIPVYCRGIS